ncbi:MAG: RNA-binding protein [Alphaproteobacteria bacterium]|nr:RNA-binding protein [Alphaproteobacteria bacterium]
MRGSGPSAARDPCRRCIVSGESRPREGLIRFVIDPEGVLTPDLAGKLPGRGLWVAAERAALEKAIAKGLFARAARARLRVPDDLPAKVEAGLLRRLSEALGLANRAGALVCGFGPVSDFLARARPAALIEAADGATDGRRKILARARPHGDVPVITILTGGELDLALGRQNMVHAALRPGPSAERVLAEARRLAGFRPQGAQASDAGPQDGEGPGPAS